MPTMHRDYRVYVEINMWGYMGIMEKTMETTIL